jgi:hypothetical protein
MEGARDAGARELNAGNKADALSKGTLRRFIQAVQGVMVSQG